MSTKQHLIEVFIYVSDDWRRLLCLHMLICISSLYFLHTNTLLLICIENIFSQPLIYLWMLFSAISLLQRFITLSFGKLCIFILFKEFSLFWGHNYAVGPWIVQGLGVPTPFAVENPGKIYIRLFVPTVPPYPQFCILGFNRLRIV